MFKVYPSSILKPFLLHAVALNLTTEDTLAPFWSPTSSKQTPEQRVKLI
jgi:hypothetical protein